MPDFSKIFQHKAYHRHFEGYVEERVTNAKGKTKIKRVYKGEYYRQNLSKVQYILLRAVYAAGMAAGIFLFVKGAAADLTSNYSIGVFAAESVTGLLMLWSVVTFLNYLMMPRAMTIGDYRYIGPSFQKALRNIVVGIAAVIIITVGYDLIFERRFSSADAVCILCFGVSCLIFAGMKFLEAHIEYQTVA